MRETTPSQLVGEGSAGPPPAAARFDPALEAWVLSSYVDVAAALRDPRLSAVGGGDDDRAAHTALRESAARALAPDLLHEWRATMLDSARRTLEDLPANEPVELVSAFARPWSRDLAILVAGAGPAHVETLVALAHDIFLAAAHATDSQRDAGALEATAALARALPASDPAIAVQAFVALAETLPCTLAAVWLELFDRPELVRRLREMLQPQPESSASPGWPSAPDFARPVADEDGRIASPAREAMTGVDDVHSAIEPITWVSRIIEELLRLASPDRAVFRQARGDLSIGEVRIRSGDRVILMLAAANRDPEAFPQPDRVDPSRSGPPHLTFGRGSHRCAGASVVRMAVTIATCALLEAAPRIDRAGDVEWLEGFAIRAPASLPVILQFGV